MLFDSGLLAFPIIGFGLVFATLVVAASELSIEPFTVPPFMEERGYSEAVVTEAFIDHLRVIDRTAGSSIRGINLDYNNLQISFAEFGNFFQINELVDGVRNLAGLVRFHVDGRITGTEEEIALTVRVFDGSRTSPTRIFSVGGSPEEVEPLLQNMAERVIETIDPYLAILYWRRREVACYRDPADCGNLDPDVYAGRSYEFPRMLEVASRLFATRLVEEHAPAYSLLGRAFMIQAESDPTLTPAERERIYDRATHYLDAALVQQPDFLFALLNHGLIAAARRNYELADVYFAHAVEADPNDLQTRVMWADLLAEQGRTLDALYQYVAAVELSPTDSRLRAALADGYAALGLPQAALEQMMVATRLDPLNEAYWDALHRFEAAAAR
jgi:tetratricopeptide (TPR) repeat protein